MASTTSIQTGSDIAGSALSKDLDLAQRQIEGPEHDRGDGGQACADRDGESLLGFEHARSESAGGVRLNGRAYSLFIATQHFVGVRGNLAQE